MTFEEAYKIMIHEGGKWVGNLGSKGAITRKRIHTVTFTDKEKADRLAAEITEMNAPKIARVETFYRKNR